MDTLYVEPNIIKYFGISLHVIRLLINDKEISDRAAPFTASDTSIHPSICEECFSAAGLPSCSDPFVFVRKHNEVVYWCLSDEERADPQLPRNQVWQFSQKDYETVLSGSTSALPDFSSEEIDAILPGKHVYPSHTGLYCVPELPDDSQGYWFLYLLELIFEAKQFALSPNPTQHRTITVGVEAEGVSECVVDIGIAEGRCCIRFSKNPTFSVWITSAEIQRSMARYLI